VSEYKRRVRILSYYHELYKILFQKEVSTSMVETYSYSCIHYAVAHLMRVHLNLLFHYLIIHIVEEQREKWN